MTVETFPHESLPKHLPILSAISPLAGHRFGHLSQLLLSVSYDGLAGWEPFLRFSQTVSSLKSHRFELATHRSFITFLLACHFKSFTALHFQDSEVPDDICFFSDNGAMTLARAIDFVCELFQSLLTKDDPIGVARGLHIPLVFSPIQSVRFKLCLAPVVSFLESFWLCNGIMRGDSSALISAYGDLCSVLVSLLHILFPSRKFSTFTDSVVMNLDVDAHPPAYIKLPLPDALQDLLAGYLPAEENTHRVLFLKNYSVSLSALVKVIQGILWCCFNEG